MVVNKVVTGRCEAGNEIFENEFAVYSTDTANGNVVVMLSRA